MGRNTMKKLVEGVKKGARTAKAAAILTARARNPARQVKFLSDAIRGKGFVLPGSKYIGPGNEMNKGKPVDEADANAYQHDKDYDAYLKKGHKAKHVYTGWSDADERLLKNTKADTPNGLAVNLGMGAKKLLHKTGLTKRIRDTDEPHKGVKRVEAGGKPGMASRTSGSRKVAIQHAQPRIAAMGNPSASGVQVRETRPMM